MGNIFCIIGICICFSSLLSFVDPDTWFFHLPVVFALGCIVYGLGYIGETLKNINHQLEKNNLKETKNSLEK